MRVEVFRIEHPNWEGYFPVASVEDLLAEHAFRSWVSGIGRHGQVTNESFDPGSPLTLVREPSNPHDPLAVSIWDASEGIQAGYLPAGMTSRMDLSVSRQACSLARLLADGECVGLQIIVARQAIELKPLGASERPPKRVWAAINKEVASMTARRREPVDPVEQMRQMLEGPKLVE